MKKTQYAVSVVLEENYCNGRDEKSLATRTSAKSFILTTVIVAIVISKYMNTGSPFTL